MPEIEHKAGRIWAKCPKCGKERWANKYAQSAPNQLCHKCALWHRGLIGADRGEYGLPWNGGKYKSQLATGGFCFNLVISSMGWLTQEGMF